MEYPKDQELLHHNQRSSLSKSQTSFLGHGRFPSDDQCPPPRHGHTHDDDGHAHDTDDDNNDALDDVFSTPPKHPPIRAYQKWKKVTLVLNASHRFHYTTDLKECKKRLHRLHTATHAVCAACRFLQYEDTRGSLENHVLDDVSEVSLQCFDAPETELTPVSRETDHVCITVLSNGYVSSMGSLPDQMASLQERHPYGLEELGGVEGVARVLEVSFENGLKDDPQYIQERRDKFGPNTYPLQPSKPFYRFVYDACKDPKLIILLVCSLGFGIISYGIKEGVHKGMIIAFAVMFVVLVTSISDYWQSLLFLHLSKEKRNITVHVIRGGRKMQVSIFELVVGDLVSLGRGDQVPADGLIVDGHSLLLDESFWTGRSDPVHRDHIEVPYLLSGCKVAEGYVTMLVTAVGMRTMRIELGRIMATIAKIGSKKRHCKDWGEETPLQVRLNGLATFVRKILLSAAVLVLLILVILYFTGHKEWANNTGKFRPGQTSNSSIMNSIVDILASVSIGDILAMAITLMIVAVPESLSVAVTFSLAYVMKKTMADRALVRRLTACETMGSVTTICTDMTDTLTLNIMTVARVWVADELRDAEDFPNISCNLPSLLLEGVAQNSSASVFVPSEGSEPEVMGSPTEKAVLMWGLRMGMNFNKVRSLSKILQVETFNSIERRAGVAVEDLNSGKVNVHWKGAAEIVLGECDFLMGTDGSILPMTAVKIWELMNMIEGMASQGLRCIAFGYKEVPTEEVPNGEQWKLPEGPLTLIAIVGIKNRCRSDVRDAVLKCKAAGIQVCMLAWDNITTAEAMATECGILADDGVTFGDYSDEMKREELPKISVMACSLPSDKLLMVHTLRAMGEVVAVTGDGTDDVPALREADIGLAMGIQGSELAKESSDIIIEDANFATVVEMVRWGRSIYVNVQKFIQFQLTVNAAASTINFISPMVGSGDAPLTAVQLLWVNLIMDTLGALALATELPTDEILVRPPIGRKDALISNIMVRNLLVQAVYQILVLLTFQFRGKQLLRLDGPNATDINNTVIFNTLVLCQLFSVLNARKSEEVNIFKGLFQNGPCMGIIASIVVIQVILVEFLNQFASTVKLRWDLWVTCTLIGLLSWPIALIGNFIPVPEKPLFKEKTE